MREKLGGTAIVPEETVPHDQGSASPVVPAFKVEDGLEALRGWAPTHFPSLFPRTFQDKRSELEYRIYCQERTYDNMWFLLVLLFFTCFEYFLGTLL
jgi:hypothetical protein